MEPEKFYHIYNHANGSENLFRSDENYYFFLRQWSKYIEPIAESYAYCLMPNHFHFLIRIREEEVISNLQGFQNPEGLKKEKKKPVEKIIQQQFSNFFNSYSKAYNKMYDRKGSLFIPRFKRKEIIGDVYLTNIIFYIHYNPVHHGFTNNITDWEHSSFHALCSTKATKLQRREVNDWFGGDEAFKKFHYELKEEFLVGKLELEFT